jgi:hypothetical protein
MKHGPENLFLERPIGGSDTIYPNGLLLFCERSKSTDQQPWKFDID